MADRRWDKLRRMVDLNLKRGGGRHPEWNNGCSSALMWVLAQMDEIETEQRMLDEEN